MRTTPIPPRLVAISLAIVACGAPAVAFAQADSQIWTSQGASGTVAGPVQAAVESTQRFGSAADGLYQITTSVALGYRLRKGVTLWAGYVDAPTYSRTAPTFVESRVREDLVATLGTLAGGVVTLRVRSEERWRSDIPGTGSRARIRLLWTRPLPALGKTALVLSHESYINFNTTDWGQKRGYERMRNAIGFAHPILRHVTGTIGYLNQYGFVRGGRDTSDNVATFGVALGF